MTKWYLVGVIIACNACSDLMNTLGMRHYGRVREFAPKGVIHLVHGLIRNYYVVAGIVALAISFIALMSLLSVAEVSFAVPATGGSFLIETVLAKLILREDVRWQRWVGALVVTCGVYLLSLP